MQRNPRQIKILELIASNVIETQEDLAASLASENFSVTQATISRDIKELGLIKVTHHDGRQKYARPVDPKGVQQKVVGLFVQATLSVDYALNLVVIKTLSGSANAAGLMVDRLEHTGVLGCVAGDDTVMIVCKTESSAATLVEALQDILRNY